MERIEREIDRRQGNLPLIFVVGLLGALMASGCASLPTDRAALTVEVWHQGHQALAYNETGGILSHVGEMDRSIKVMSSDEQTSASVETRRTKQTLGNMWSAAAGVVAGWIAKGGI